VYRARVNREVTSRRMAGRLLSQVFDGAMDQMMDSLFSAKPPSREELSRLEELIEKARKGNRGSGQEGENALEAGPAPANESPKRDTE